MDDKNNKLAQALIMNMTNEMCVIELYRQSLSLQLGDDIRKRIEAMTRDEERHVVMLNDMFQKRIGKKVDASKVENIAIKTVKNLASEPFSIHLIDVALGYEHREKNYLEKSRRDFVEDEELNKLFSEIIGDEEGHIVILEKERKAVLGLPFDEFELDLYVRE